MFEIPSPYRRPSSTNALGWKPGTCASHGSRPEYEVSMWPLNMRLGPPPTPARVPRTFARPSSTCCHCTCRPMPTNVSRISSPIASSEPVKLGVPMARDAQSTRRSRSIRISATDVWEHLLAEEADLVAPAVTPELEHHVGAPCLAVLLDRRDAVLGRARDRLAAVEERVGHLCLRGEASSLLHRLGHRSELVHLDAGELEQRVRRAADVLELVREVHAGDLAGAVAACLAVALVDRGDDRAADVDVGSDVLARVADEGGRRDRRRQAAVADLAGERLHLRRGRRDVDGRHLAGLLCTGLEPR